MIHITAHALERFVERVDPSMTTSQAQAAIRCSERAICTAAGFGCDTVKLGSGARLILDGLIVVTVLAPGKHARKSLASREAFLR